MAIQHTTADQMTVEQFLAFADTKPDGETWELIEGVPVIGPSPNDWHPNDWDLTDHN
jgi:Uma2 family endonuclease